jgi:hypothetical protein
LLKLAVSKKEKAPFFSDAFSSMLERGVITSQVFSPSSFWGIDVNHIMSKMDETKLLDLSHIKPQLS